MKTRIRMVDVTLHMIPIRGAELSDDSQKFLLSPLNVLFFTKFTKLIHAVRSAGVDAALGDSYSTL